MRFRAWPLRSTRQTILLLSVCIEVRERFFAAIVRLGRYHSKSCSLTVFGRGFPSFSVPRSALRPHSPPSWEFSPPVSCADAELTVPLSAEMVGSPLGSVEEMPLLSSTGCEEPVETALFGCWGSVLTTVSFLSEYPLRNIPSLFIFQYKPSRDNSINSVLPCSSVTCIGYEVVLMWSLRFPTRILFSSLFLATKDAKSSTEANLAFLICSPWFAFIWTSLWLRDYRQFCLNYSGLPIWHSRVPKAVCRYAKDIRHTACIIQCSLS